MSKNTTDTSAKSLVEEIEKGNVGERQSEVFAILKQASGPLTDREIHKELQKAYPEIQVAHVTPRRNELWKLGYISRNEKRKCSITGKLAYTWKVKQR